MIPERYTLSNLKSTLGDREKLFRELIRINGLFNPQRRHATRVMAEDWDNLLILDGCRYDTFAEQNTVQFGTESFRISLGSTSSEFLKKNFAGKTYHDTVYVSANPFVPSLTDGTFHAVVNLLNDNWDDELSTVHPKDVVAEAKRTHEQFPNKRLIVHFMQPHYPFIGETGRKLSHRGFLRDQTNSEQASSSIWLQLQREEVSREVVWTAYRENLDLVLDHVNELTDALPGLHAVTADHGNLIGDRTYPIPIRGYGHPHSAHVSPLVKVPWAVTQTEDRRLTSADSPQEQEDIDESLVQDRLQALGYASE